MSIWLRTTLHATNHATCRQVLVRATFLSPSGLCMFDCLCACSQALRTGLCMVRCHKSLPACGPPGPTTPGTSKREKRLSFRGCQVERWAPLSGGEVGAPVRWRGRRPCQVERWAPQSGGGVGARQVEGWAPLSGGELGAPVRWRGGRPCQVEGWAPLSGGEVGAHVGWMGLLCASKSVGWWG